jgi:peptidoglycan hydrolase-like protein with peptidoglycan-binding domain
MSALGFYSGEADGVFDASTQSALANFQSSNGLTPTAVPDADTVIKFIELSTGRVQSGQGQ